MLDARVGEVGLRLAEWSKRGVMANRHKKRRDTEKGRRLIHLYLLS